MYNDKGISSIVVASLLLVLTVLASISFSIWFDSYSSNMLSSVESGSLVSSNIDIEGVYKNQLYISSLKNDTLLFLEIFDIKGDSVCSFYSSGVTSNSSLVGWWKFDDESSVIKDYSGNGNDGLLYGNTRLLIDFDDGTAIDKTTYSNDGAVNGAVWNDGSVDGDCISGGCFEFDGVDDYITIPNNETINMKEFSINVNFYYRGNDSYTSGIGQYLVSKIYSNSIKQYGIYIYNGLLSYAVANSTDTSIITYGIFDEGWYNAVGTYNGSRLNLYLDGNLVASVDREIDVVDNGYYLNIGSKRNNYGFFNGSIDEVSIYSKALNDDEVKYLYNSKKAKFIEFKDSKIDKAVEFDGIDDYVELDVSSLSSNVTILSWFKMNSVACDEVNILLSTGFAGQNGIAFTTMNGDNVCDDVILKGASALNTEGTYSSNISGLSSWNHIVGVSDTNGLYLYLNGNLISSNIDSEVPMDITSKYFIGSAINGLGSHVREFNGLIDEIRVYNRSLSLAEVNSLMLNGFMDLEDGMNSLNVSDCNLEKGHRYEIVTFTNSKKVEQEIIVK